MITIEKQQVSPQLAMKWLERNGKNRKLTDRNVTFLSNQINSGEWKITGDPVKFDVNKKLIDGQHRLSAIVKSGKTIELFVANGLPEDVFDVLDTGRGRSGGDVLSSLGYRNYNHLSSISKGILMFEAGYLQAPNKANKLSVVTNAKILKFVKAHPELEEIVTYIVSSAYENFRPIGPTILGTIYYLISKKNQSKADVFFEKYSTGIDLGKNSPIRILREKLLRNQTNKSKLSTRDKYALLIMAWNAFLKNKEVESLALRTGYEFPKIV